MNIVDMRYVLSQAYPGPGWKKKVSNMSDEQVVAVYYRIVNGKPALSRKSAKTTTPTEVFKNVTNALVDVAEKRAKYIRTPYDFEEDGPKQMTLADIMEG